MTEHEHMATWPFNVRLMRYAPGTYAVYALSIFLFLTGQVIPGMVIKAIFDSRTGHQDAGFGIPALVALFVAIETARFAISFTEVWSYVTFFLTTGALLRRNILAAIMRRPGAVLHASGGGIRAVDIRLRAGTLTVVTGRVGSGKTTLLRTILGLLPVDEGEIHWDDRLVTDSAEFFRAPHSAYVPQVPRLFSEQLIENILMGWPASDARLGEAIRLAVL
jgi:ABC-type multidrug transport system fused ATPase/permease subunit